MARAVKAVSPAHFCYASKMVHRTKLTPERKSRFLALLAQSGNVTLSVKGIGCARRSLYDARERDPEFAVAWDAAVEEGLDTLEEEARPRAVEGYDVPVYHQGKVVGIERRYSDQLLLHLLRSYRRERYRGTAPEKRPTLVIETSATADSLLS